MKKYKYLIIDLDNTLFDFDKSESESLKKVFDKYGIDFNQDNFLTYEGINNHLWQEYEKGSVSKDFISKNRFTRFSQKLGVLADGLQMELDYRQALAESFHLFDGITDTLDYLVNEGYILFAGTNGISHVQRSRIQKAGIHNYFHGIFISDEIGFSKPDTRFFDAIFINTPAMNKNNTIMIGDSLTSDMAGAINYKIDSVWIDLKNQLEDKHHITYHVNHFNRVTSIF